MSSSGLEKSAAPSEARSEENACWRARIQRIQLEIATPETNKILQLRASRQQRCMKQSNRAVTLARWNSVSSASSTIALRSTSLPSNDQTNQQQQQQRERCKSIIRNVSKSSSDDIRSGKPRRLPTHSNDVFGCIAEEDEPSDSDDSRGSLEMMEAELMGSFVPPAVDAASAPTLPLLPPPAVPLDEDSDNDSWNDDNDGLSTAGIFSFGRNSRSVRSVDAPSLTVSDLPLNAQAATLSFSTISSELSALFEQFSVEPTDNAEAAAKFELYENFLSTVVSIREQTLLFWEDNKEEFVGAVRLASEKMIQNIDRAEALGIQDHGHRWFLYHMAKQAHKNSEDISAVLETLRRNLVMLANEDLGDCPFCLEKLTLENSTLLGCCHRSCSDCWTNWVNLKGRHSFCPLCKHVEFLEVIID